MKVPYFPFPPVFDLKMGTAPLESNHPLVEPDQHYKEEVLLKRTLLKEDHRYYYQSKEGTLSAQWAVLRKLLESLTQNHPDSFHLEIRGDQWTWTNHLLGETTSFEIDNSASLASEPLDWVGQQVQEDLLLLDANSNVVAGQLCFPSGWCLDEKMGMPFLQVHAPLPGFMNPMLQAAEKLIERIPPHRPIGRTNWGFRVCDQLDLSTKHREAYQKLLADTSRDITDTNAGDKVYFRIERQTLSRQTTGHVLFTIHTYNSFVREEVQDPQRGPSMLSFLKTVPEELFAYKLITPYAKALIGYLENACRNNR